MPNTIMVKLGGSIITDKEHKHSVRTGTIKRLIREIKAVHATRPDLQIILGHGAGSFGHFAASEHGLTSEHRATDNPLAIAHINNITRKLNQIVVAHLIEEGIPAIAFPVSVAGKSSSGQLLDFPLEIMHSTLQSNMMPVFHGDIVADKNGQWGIVSTEAIFFYLTPHLTPKEIIMVGEVDGIYTADPLKTETDTHRISEISADTIEEVTAALSGSHGVDVTGGMKSKVLSLYALLEKHPQLIIRFISGKQPEALQRTLQGENIPESTVMHY